MANDPQLGEVFNNTAATTSRDNGSVDTTFSRTSDLLTFEIHDRVSWDGVIFPNHSPKS